MAGIDEVLERLVAEPEFREQLRADPAEALSDYALDDEDLEVLASTLDESDGGEHAVEQRTSKSALLTLLTAGFDAASAQPSLSGPGVPTPDPNLAAADGPDEADILVGKITPKGGSHAASRLDPTELGPDPANVSDPAVHVQEDPEGVADSHDRYANQPVNYLLQGDGTAADEAHTDHPEVLPTGSSTDDAEGVEDLAGAPDRVEPAVPEFDTSTAGNSSDVEGHGELDGVETKQIQEVSGLKIEVDEIELEEDALDMLDQASGKDAAAKDGTISIEGKDVTVKGRTRGVPPTEEGADDLSDGAP